jgi:hypothetical protein
MARRLTCDSDSGQPRLPSDPAKAYRLAVDDTFTRAYFGEPFKTTADARRLWPAYRRAVWAATPRGSVPRAGAAFDAIAMGSARLLADTWNHQRFDLAALLAAVERDRAALAAFEARDPRGAKAIADYLAILRGDLDAIEEHGRVFAAWPDPPHTRPFPLIAGQRLGTYGA